MAYFESLSAMLGPLDATSDRLLTDTETQMTLVFLIVTHFPAFGCYRFPPYKHVELLYLSSSVGVCSTFCNR